MVSVALTLLARAFLFCRNLDCLRVSCWASERLLMLKLVATETDRERESKHYFAFNLSPIELIFDTVVVVCRGFTW